MKKKLFPILLVGTLVIGGAALLAIWRGTPSTTEDFLASGKKYFAEGKYEEAKVQLQIAARKDERNREAGLMLARTYIGLRDINSAVRQLSLLLEFYPDDKEVNLQLGNLYLEAGSSEAKYFREAAKIAEKILALDPQNVGALILAGNAAGGQRDYTSSLVSLEKAVSLDPENAPAFVSLGTTQTLQKHFPEAEKAFLRAREIDSKNKSALISLANYYRTIDENAKAEAAFKDALAAYPADVLVYTQLVQLYYQTNRFDEGVKLLQDLQAKDPKTPAPSLVLQDMYLAKGRQEDARKLLTDLKKKYPKDLDIAVRLAVFYMGSDRKQAREEVERILAVEPNSPVGNLLMGEIEFFDGKVDDAQALFSKPQVANSALAEAQFFLGNLAGRKGEFDKAQDYYEKAVRKNPRYVVARVALAETLLQKGKSAEARKELEIALNYKSDFVPARLLMASLNRSEKRFAEAEAELTALAREQPQNPVIQRNLAVYYDDRGQTANTEKSLSKALELEPESLETLTAMTKLNVKARQFDKAIQQINAIPEARKVAYHYELLGAVYAEAGKPKDAEAAFKKAAEKDPKRSTADSILAAEYIKTGRLAEGLGKLEDVLKKDPKNASAYGTKGMVLEQQGKTSEAIKSYEEALRADPRLDAAGNNLAYIYAEEGTNLEKALDLARNARKNQPNSPDVADTLGWVYHKLGNQGLAKEQLQFAISKQSGNPTLHYHLGMIYKASKQMKEAEAELKKAIASPTDFKERTLAQGALKEVTGSR